MIKADKALHTFWQRPGVSNDEYATQFDAFVTVIEKLGGTIPIHNNLLEAMLEKNKKAKSYALLGTSNEYKAAATEVREEYLAGLLLMGANHDRFQSLCDKLANDMLSGHDGYPKTREDVLVRLNHWKGPPTSSCSTKGDVRAGGRGEVRRR